MGATGSEAAPPGDRSGRGRGGRGAAAATSAAAAGVEVERAERRGELPARKPDPEPGGMDHHQLATGRYQVVSARAPGLRESGVLGIRGSRGPGDPLPR